MIDRADYFRRLARRFSNHGYFIEAGWCELYANAPTELDPAAFELARAMYFHGAIHATESMLMAAQGGEELGSKFFELVKAELVEHQLKEQLEYGEVAGSA